MKKEVFEEIGLSEGEEEVYNLLLNMGKSSAGQIAARSSFNRSTVYDYLSNLVEAGLVEKNINKKRAYYEPLNPEIIKKMLEEKKHNIQNINRSFEKILPGLKSNFKDSVQKPIVKYYDGIGGIKKAYEDSLLSNTKQIKMFRSVYDNKRLKRYLDCYLKPQQKAVGIKLKLISPARITKEKIAKDKKWSRERRYVSPERFSLPSQISVYNDKVTIFSLRKKPMGILIENKDLAESIEKIFDCLWESLEEPK